MLRFFRQIRQRFITDNKFSKYLLYAVGEILLVVIGILIALQVDNWNENRKEIANLVATLNSAKGHIQTEIKNGEWENESLSKWIQNLDSAVAVIINENDLSEENQWILERAFPDLSKIGLLRYNTDILNNLADKISEAKLDSDLTTEISRLIQDIEVNKWLADNYRAAPLLDVIIALDPRILTKTWEEDYVYDFQLMKTDKTFRRLVQRSRSTKQDALNRNIEIVKKLKALNEQVDRLLNDL